MLDYEEMIVVSTSAFFTVLALGLLIKYRQVSQSLTESTNLGKDLWNSLESRLRKQDERILDMMARVEVIQARVLTLKTVSSSSSGQAVPPNSAEMGVQVEAANHEGPSHGIEPQREMQQESREPHGESHNEPSGVPDSGVALALDETQMTALKLLSSKPMDTREITNALGKSREHTARVMKELFEMGLVARTTNEKPFTYELTDRGRRQVPPSS